MTTQSDSKVSTVQEGQSIWTRPAANYILWTLQGLLAALFLFAGVTKLILPIDAMTQQISLPGWFLRFIGVAEVLGAVGLVLPWLLGIRPTLTPLAASCLLIIMIGATAISFSIGGFAAALTPAVAGILSLFVAYGRSASFTISSKSH